MPSHIARVYASFLCPALRLIARAGVTAFAVTSCATTFAGVYLSSTSFTANNPPYVWTDESMPANYRLRVKIMDVPEYGDGFHAATAMNNSWTALSAIPAPGRYWTETYWIKYDDWENITEIGPVTGGYVTITPADTALSPVQITSYRYVAGADQSYVVPTGANYLILTAWGGGGGGGTGGHGGSITASVNVRPGDRITMVVASGGSVDTTGWPGGGSPGRDYETAYGGGYTRVQTPSGELWAGGGGGGVGLYGGGNGGAAESDTTIAATRGNDTAGGNPGTATGGGLGGQMNAWSPRGGSGAARLGGNGLLGQGAGGGGGGYFGGGGGGAGGSGGGGSSVAVGSVHLVRYAYARNGSKDQTTVKGGEGGVVIRAYSIGTPTLPLTITTTSEASTVWSPLGATPGYIVAKAWGAGGGAGGFSSGGVGGAGAYALAVFANVRGLKVTPGTFGNAGWYGGIGGRATLVSAYPASSWMVVGGGGGGGSIGAGGTGGAPNGGAGVTGLGASSGGGATVTWSGNTPSGYGGAGGTGTGLSGTDVVGNGAPGGDNLSLNYSNSTNGGNRGEGGDTTDSYVWGGYGGGGFSGGGGGGSTGNINEGGATGGGGGGGGSTVVYSSSGSIAQLMLAGNGGTAPATNDPHYPGNNVGRGGPVGSSGGQGAVVLIAYPPTGAAPAITAATAQSVGRNHATDIAIAATEAPMFYTASGLPPGLSLDRFNGHVVGVPTTEGTFASTISATNPYGTGQATIVWTVTAADSSAPGTPTNLQASAASLTSVTLTWTAPSDNVGIYGYEIQQDGVTVATSSVASATIGGLASGSAHTYKVRARDPAENWSAWSSATTVTLTDQIAPSSPTALNYADISATTVTLIWRPATDNVGVAGYSVYRGGQLVGTTTELAFHDAGLSASTAYSYTVKAFDAAANTSALSSTLNVTTTQDFSADTDHDSLPDAAESALGTNVNSAGSPDSSNQTQQNIHRPIK